MAARNSSTSYGSISRVLHWSTAAVVLTALLLGIWISEMEVSLASIRYFGIHKSIGFVALVLVLIRIVWHWITPPPGIESHGVWKDRLAHAVHRLFYVCLVLMPLSGWFASSASGIDTVLFNEFTLPRIAPVSTGVEDFGFRVHAATGTVLIALIVLHVAGAFYRALVLKDGTIARMLRG